MQRTSANLSSAVDAKRRTRSCCALDRILTTKPEALRSGSRLGEERERLHSTRGGFNETELKEFTVIPMAGPSTGCAVITAIPVANRLNAPRSDSGSNVDTDPAEAILLP